jgi:hypothetical protein
MNPLKFRMAMDYLTRIKKVKPDLPDVFPASQAPIPPIKEDVKLREAVNRFVRDNPRQQKAGGGMLVQPGFGGTRQAYGRPGGNPEFGKTITGSQFKDTIRPQNLKKLKKLEEIITKSNSQYKKSLTSKAALELAGFKGGYQAIATKGKLREEVKKLIGTLQSTADKMDNYINNVMLSEDALVKDFKSPMQHLQKKFGVSKSFTDKWAPTSQVVQDNKRLFNNLANDLSFNKYKNYADGTPRLMSDFSIIAQNKLPSSTSLLRGDSAEKFILQSAYRHFKYNKDVGKASKIKFIGDPDLLPINEWKFIKGDKLFSLDPAEDTIKFQGKNYKNNYLNRVDAKDIYKNDFGDVYKIFDDLDKYMNTTTVIGNKDVKLDTVLRRKLFDATGKKNYLLRRAVEIDHFDINKDPFSNLRLLDRRTNVQAGLIKKLPKYKNNPKLLNKVLTDIGYTTPYKDVDTFIKRTTRNIDTPIKVIGDQNKKVIPAIDKVLASFGDGACAVQFGKGNKDGGRIGYATGTASLNDCIASGTKNFNDGKFKTADQVQDAAKLLRGGRAVISGLMKYGIIPELAYVGLEAAGRTLLGEKPTNSLLKSIDTLTFGATDFTSGIEAEKFGKFSDQKLAVDKFRNSQALVNSLQSELNNLETISGQGGEDYIGNLSADIQVTKERLQRAQKSLQENKVSPDILQFIDRKGQEIADTQLAKSLYSKAGLKDQLEGIPGISDYTDTEPARIFPKQREVDLNLDMFPQFSDATNFMQLKTNDAIDLAQSYRSEGQDVSAKDILAYRDLLRNSPLSELAQTYGDEQIYGTQGISAVPLNVDLTNYQPSNRFGSNPQQRPILYPKGRGVLAGGGIAKLAGVDSGPPPASGPNSQGLQGLMKRVKRI